MSIEYTLHKAESRGFANHGWLKSAHTFSFANYYNPERIHFGVLRVLNDDYVAPKMGFGMHPHENMEIISIPLSGELEHQDSMGNTTTIKKGDIQVMSAGTGVNHREYNPNQLDPSLFLQIWVIPNKKNVNPRYDQITLNIEDRKNKLQQILSPNQDDEGVWIHQHAWFHLGKFDENHEETYSLKKKDNGIYLFLLEGRLSVNGQELKRRDGLGIKKASEISLLALENNTEVLLMEVPLTN